MRLVPTVVLFSSSLVATTVLAASGTCEIGIEGALAYQGTCEITHKQNGDFSFSAEGGKVYAEARGLSGNAEGTARFKIGGRNHDGSIGALYEGGYSKREGCWGNRSIEICAFGGEKANVEEAPRDQLVSKIFGSFQCNGGFGFELSGNRYNGQQVDQIEAFNDGKAYGITLKDGYRFGIMEGKISSEWVWTSPQSGDSFTCRKDN